MTPMASNPADPSYSNNDSNRPVFDGMNLAESTQHFVDSSTSDIDSSPDIGTHSNFASQQSGPDATYDTLVEGNGAPPPTDAEDDIDSDTSDVDSTPDVGIEGTFANAQGATNDSSYFALTEESVISAYGGETGGVFVTGSVPDMAGNDQYAFYQAIFWNPTDDVYQVSRVEFSYTGSTWLKNIAQGSGSSSPTSGWSLTSGQVAAWTSGTPITVQPHTAASFYVRGDSNKRTISYYIDIGITANSSTYTESYHSAQDKFNQPSAQLWLGSSLPPTQIHSVSSATTTTVYVSLEEDDGGASILSGGTLTIDVPTGFTSITDVGGTNWGAATINGNQIVVSNTAPISGSYLTYGFQITSPSTPGLYKLDIAFDDGSNAHPIGNFTIHVTGIPPAYEKINLEYQWTTASYDETYEEVCIYIGSHTGSENLAVNYWDGFSWNALGTITAATTGWANFTATGLSSSTYTIQLVGTSESTDVSKDIWNIDLITLHTWSLQTYNYKLDLEIQWTAANYTQDNEELCIHTGSLDSEGIRVDVWNGADWTNIALDLVASDWNNFSISTWLTSSVFTIRFRGDIEVSDTTQSSWEIDVSLLHTWDNEVPQNSATPVISNLDDTTFLYAEYRQYELTAEVTDLDGFAEIDYVELTLTSNDRGTSYWSIRYDEDTDSFTEQSDPSDYITLDAGSSSAVEAGNSISATFFITVNWDHPDVVDTDLKSEVYDATPSSDLDYYEVNWDVETRLDLSSGPTLNDGSGTSTRGDLDNSMTASGTITYLGSALHPAAADIAIWISSSQYGTQTGPWEAINYEDTGGTFSATVYADDQVGIDDYTFKAVTEGAGASGGDHFSASQTAQYISDVVQVQSYSSDDSRINVNTTASLHAVLYYDYDNSFVVDGTVTINGITATYSGSNGVWDFTDEQSTAQLVTYDTLVYSGGTHGITGEDQNGQSFDQIWDYVKVVSYSPVDARVDVNSNAIIDVTLIYEYDGTSVVDGSITINGETAIHQGVGVWRITVSSASVQGVTYDLVVASGNTHGITLIDQNSQSQLVVWDRVIVTGYSVADNHVTVDDSVNLDVTLEYEYDSAPVTDGSVTVNLVSASHTGGGVWRITVSKSTVQGVTYNSVVCSGNTFGISEVNQNSQSQLIIWDQITVRSYSVADNRVTVGDGVNIDVTLEYEYDDSDVTDGTVTINENSATHQALGVWRIVDTEATVLMNTYDTVACSGNTLGISSVNQNSQSIDVIWDQITVRSYTVLDDRVNIGANVNVDVLLEYEYDDTAVTDGTVTINTISATHQGVGVWRIVETKATVQFFTYDTIVCSGNAHGVTSVNQNGQSTIVIWDQVTVRSYTVVDSRVSVDDSVNIDVLLEYEYDDSIVTDGTVTINTISATHQGAGVWRIIESKATVQSVTYDTIVCSGNTHGISSVNQNSQSTSVIWDQVTVRSYTVADNRVNIDDSVNIDVTLEYEYDDSDVTDGTVTINTISATHQGAGVWRIVEQKATVQSFTYDTIVCSGNSLGISSVNQNGQSTTVIWDQITVRSYTVIDARVNIDDSVNIDVLLEYEYDDAIVVDGSVTINTISASYVGSGIWRITESKATVESVTYDTVVCSGNAFGISDVNQNSKSTEVIWDRVIVQSYSIQDARVDISIVVTFNFTLEYEHDGTPVIDGIVTLNGVSASHVSGGVWEIAQSRSSVQAVTYSSVICSGNLHGIDEVNLNSQSQEIIWDQITVRSYSVVDNRVNLDDSVNIDVTLEYEYDDSDVTDGTVTITGNSATHQGLGVWRISQSRSSVQEVTFDTVACSANTYGISSVNQNSQSTAVIWDQITVRGYEVSDARDNVGDTITVTVELEYEYDDSDVTDGSITINSVSYTYTGSLGKWSASRMQGTVGAETFDTVTASGNTHGITDVNQDGQSQTIIWDRIQVSTTTVDDGRIDIDSSCEIRVTLILEYDSTPLGLGDSVTLDGVAMVWDAGDSRFELARLQSSVGEWLYYVNSSLETTFGISALDINSQEVSVIWDQIIILTTVVDDGRVGIGSSVELRVTAELVFDGHSLGSGDSIVMDSASMTWDVGNGWFDLSRVQSTVGLWNYLVDSAAEVTYGITALDLNGTNQDVIWDNLNVYIVADMDSVDNGIQVNFTMTVTFEYDLAVCTTYNLKVARNGTYWHTFTNVNVTDFIDTNSDMSYLYNATIINSETTYGITVFSTNIETVVWGGGSAAPANAAAPALINPDDTDFMFARLRFYIITSNVSDAQGYVDIDYVELSLWDNSRSVEIWRIRFTNSTNTFSIEAGSAYIQLGSGCTYTKTGFDIDITWSIKIDWDHQDRSNVDFKQYVVDDGAEFDENWYEVDYDVETRLDYSTTPSLSDDRGDLSTSDLECTGTAVYYGSSLHPLANETDVWVSHDVSGTWSSNLDISGDFTVSSIGSSSSVRLNTYTIKIVANGDGSGGTDLYYTTSETAEFITDQIEFYNSGTDYARVNVGDGGVIWWNARYDYDNTEITGGLIADLNGSKTLLWDNGLSHWYYVEVSGIVDQIGYSILSASESGFSLTGWTQTASDVSEIWDLIVVRSYSVADTRTNVSDLVNIDVLLEYEFDDSFVADGTVQINSALAVYQGSGIWRISETNGSVTSVLYNSVSCSSNTHNITNVYQNAQSVTVIWDRIIVGSYSVTDVHVNVDDAVNIDVTLTFEFDATSVLDGTVSINGFSATHQGLGVWRITQSRSSIQSVSFDTVSCSGNTHGIAVVNQNSQSEDVIWDKIVVQSYTVLDNRINVDDSANIDFVLHYGYDDSPVTDGSVSINAVAATHQGSGTWRIIDTQSSVQLVTYNTVVCSGNSFGISNVDQNGQSEAIIWDQIIVISYSVDDNRVDLDTVVVVNVTLEYEYDSTSVVNGVVIIQSVSSSHVGNGIWQINMSKSSVQMVSFDTVVCSGNSHGISSVNQNSQQSDVVWDKITIRSYTVTDTRVNVDDSVNIDALIEYEYDDSPVTDGTVTINGASATHQGVGVWRISDSKSSIQAATYNLVLSSGNLHGISEIDQNSQSITIIWDQIVVQSYSILDNHVNVDDTVSIDVVLQYGYDSSPLIDGSVSINAIAATHQGSGTWRFSDVKSSVQAFTYDTVSCSGNTHGITIVDQNGQSEQVIWDQIVVLSYAVVDSRVEIDILVTINVTLEYDYDNTDVVDGVVLIQSGSATHAGNGVWQISMVKSSVQSVSFDSVICSGNSPGISSVNQNSQSTIVIWDQITVRSYSVADNRVNVDDSVNIDVLIEYEYDDSPVTDGTVTINGASATHQGVGVWRISNSESTVQSVTYNVIACSGNLHGISIIDQNSQSQSVIWDQIVVLSYQVLDTRVDIDDTVNVDVVLEYEFDNTDVVDGSVQINGVVAIYQSGGIWRISEVESVVGLNTYDTVACSGNGHGITSVDQNGQSIAVIWDQITVRLLTASDERDEIGSTVTVSITLEYEHDDSDVTDGLVIINSIPFTYTGSNGVWFTDRLQNSVTSETYNITVVSGNTFAITEVNQNGLSLTVIWDRISILTTTVDDSRLNTDATARIMVTAELEYDGHLLGAGDSLVLDGSALTWDAGNSWFYLDVTQSTVGLWNYYVNTTGALESDYGISQITVAGQSQNVIWDQLSITVTPDDTSVNDYDVVVFTLEVSYSYDSSPCTSYVIDISRNGTYWHTFTIANISQFVDTNNASTYLFTALSVSSETTFGITVFSNNTVSVTWSTPTNFAPFNNEAPTLENPDDSDNMYARFTLYTIRSSIVDYDGYSDVDYVELSLWDNSRWFELWRVRYTSSTQTFSIEVGSEYIQLYASSSNQSIGFLLNITWALKIDWDHFDMQDVDVYQYVMDLDAVSDSDWFEVDWDVETQLDYDVQPSLSDDRGDLDTNDLQASGTVVYYGSSLSPMINETEIWVIHDFSGSWSGNIDIVGEFTVTGIGSSSSVRLNVYTFKIVAAGLGPASADLYYDTSPTANFITDSIEFYASGTLD